MKTITMSLKEYEDIIKLKEETEAAIEKNMVCREVGGLGPVKIEWIHPDTELETLSKEIKQLNAELYSVKKDYHHEVGRVVEYATTLGECRQESANRLKIIDNNEIGFQVRIDSIKSMSVRHFKRWKKS